MLPRLLRKIESVRPFRETEAWALFRLSALGEGVGWTLLVSAIGITRYNLPGHAYAVPIAGQIHGTLFLVYFGALLATYSSLRWPRRLFLLAALAGVVPFGTILFEQFVARRRHRRLQVAFISSLTLHELTEQPEQANA